MHELYELKEMLCKELEELGSKGELTAGSLDTVDKLAHAAKNLDKLIEKYEEEEYSNANGDMSYGGGMSSRSSYRDGRSYARGRGRYAKRDSMGRYSSRYSRNYSRDGYSRDGDVAARLEEIMSDVPDEMIRQEIQRIVEKMR